MLVVWDRSEGTQIWQIRWDSQAVQDSYHSLLYGGISMIMTFIIIGLIIKERGSTREDQWVGNDSNKHHALRRYPASSNAGHPQEICSSGQNNGPGKAWLPHTKAGPDTFAVTAQYSGARNKHAAMNLGHACLPSLSCSLLSTKVFYRHARETGPTKR